MSLNETPTGNRLHVAIFGKRNSGKSSLLNAITGQEIALVSDEGGTTTDPVYKAMEVNPIGPVLFIDTAGFDDEGSLGEKRVEKTKEVIKKTDVAIVLFDEGDFKYEKGWIKLLQDNKIPVIPVINKSDLQGGREGLTKKVADEFKITPLVVSARAGQGVEKIREELEQVASELAYEKSIMGDMAKEDDLVMLVMPQDIQAPKGRLILPQVQTLRELLDKKCTVVCTTAEKFENSLKNFSKNPDLIVTDSQCFKQVYEAKPENSKLTSFSVLFAAYKGDISEFEKGVYAIKNLSKDSRVLIAEACTHAPLEEDIGRVKIPKILEKKFPGIKVEIVAGKDFPENLGLYDMVIHCGACMFNRKHVMTRVEQAKDQGVPITNYGMVMAYFAGILDKIQLPRD